LIPTWGSAGRLFLGPALLFVGSVAAGYWSTASSATPGTAFAALFLVTVTQVAACCVALVGLLLLSSQPTRARGKRLLKATALWVVFGLLGRHVASVVRLSALLQGTRKAQPIVAAITKFSEAEGRLPARLSDLVPGYLSTVPRTAWGAYPEWQYARVAEPSSMAGNSWVLFVETPSGEGFDVLMFLPSGRYPDRAFGGSVKRLGSWAYVFE